VFQYQHVNGIQNKISDKQYYYSIGIFVKYTPVLITVVCVFSHLVDGLSLKY